MAGTQTTAESQINVPQAVGLEFTRAKERPLSAQNTKRLTPPRGSHNLGRVQRITFSDVL